MTERTAEEWGRVAMGLPGWRWMAGMFVWWALDEDDDTMPLRLVEDASSGHRYADGPVWSAVRSDGEYNDHELVNGCCWPAPDDKATIGCLESLLGDEAWRVRFLGATAGAWCWEVITDPMDPPASGQVFAPDEKGRACIAAAEAVGRWPGST